MNDRNVTTIARGLKTLTITAALAMLLPLVLVLAWVTGLLDDSIFEAISGFLWIPLGGLVALGAVATLWQRSLWRRVGAALAGIVSPALGMFAVAMLLGGYRWSQPARVKLAVAALLNGLVGAVGLFAVLDAEYQGALASLGILSYGAFIAAAVAFSAARDALHVSVDDSAAPAG